MEGEVIQIKQDRLNQMPNKVTAQLKEGNCYGEELSSVSTTDGG